MNPPEQPTSAPRARKLTLRRKILFSLIPLLLAYVIAETVATTLYVQGTIEPIPYWYQEDTPDGSTIQFDPIRGYRLSSTPSRMACITSNGTIESVGVVRGNNHGFPDRDDFEPARGDSKAKRFAVFGDSFTAAQYLKRNWPDAVEDLTRNTDQPLELLNFSIDGGGIINWWSVLTRLIDPEDYELDGIIFAVFGNDLRRGFTFWDDRIMVHNPAGHRTIAFGAVPNLNIELLPTTLEDARPYFHQMDRWRVVSPQELDRLIAGQSRPTTDRTTQLYLLRKCLESVFVQRSQNFALPNEITDPTGFPLQLQDLMLDIQHFAQNRKIPITVVHIPRRNGLLHNADSPRESRSFAKFVHAKFIDGNQAFQNLSQAEIRACWLPYDGHWGQSGSDRFAEFMSRALVVGHSWTASD